MALPNRSPERVLVIHSAFLGDIILATPVLAGLRRLLPKAEIRFLTTPGGAALLEANPWGVKCISFDKRGAESGLGGLWKKGRELRAFGPQVTLNLHRSFRSALLARLAGGEIWGFAEAAGSFLFHGRASREGIAYEAQKNLAVLEGWSGQKNFPVYPELKATPENEAAAAALLGGARKFAVLAPSSVWATKRWPGEKFGQLAKLLKEEQGLEPVVIGGPEDAAASRALLEVYPALDLTGRTSLGVLKALLAKAEIVVTNDSSPLHMAIAMGSKAVGIFGPTTKSLGFFPLAPQGRAGVAERAELECRPCGLHGHDRCPLGHFRCMLELDVQQVYGEVKRVLCR